MKKQSEKVKITGMVLVVVLVLALVVGAVYMGRNPSQTVSVSGNAEVKVMPDLVSVYFNVESLADTAKEAKDANTEIVDEVVVELMRMGVGRKDIVTSNYNIYPEYEWKNDERELVGYKAMHTLKVELSEETFDKAGDVVDAGVDAGALVSYINFELSSGKQNEYKAQAIEQATFDARAKAEGIAEGLGRDLGRIVSVSTSDFGYAPWRLYAADESSFSGGADLAKEAVESINIQPGEQTVVGRVSVLYALS